MNKSSWLYKFCMLARIIAVVAVIVFLVIAINLGDKGSIWIAASGLCFSLFLLHGGFDD